jgi:hypothetical protein
LERGARGVQVSFRGDDFFCFFSCDHFFPKLGGRRWGTLPRPSIIIIIIYYRPIAYIRCCCLGGLSSRPLGTLLYLLYYARMCVEYKNKASRRTARPASRRSARPVAAATADSAATSRTYSRSRTRHRRGRGGTGRSTTRCGYPSTT